MIEYNYYFGCYVLVIRTDLRRRGGNITCYSTQIVRCSILGTFGHTTTYIDFEHIVKYILYPEWWELTLEIYDRSVCIRVSSGGASLGERNICIHTALAYLYYC
jgi:hypothetical protein